MGTSFTVSISSAVPNLTSYCGQVIGAVSITMIYKSQKIAHGRKHFVTGLAQTISV